MWYIQVYYWLNCAAVMAMNTRDERLYHYEYRRPRFNNPTYNSSHVFDSLHMMIRPPQPPSHLRSYGRYSLEGNESLMANSSDIVGVRKSRQVENYSTINPPRESSRQARLLSDKDSLYLQMLEEKGRARSGRSIGFEMGNSRLSQNAENHRNAYIKGGDSLTKEMKNFEAQKK